MKMEKIRIKKSSCADTRTCDWSKVTKQQLLEQSEMHIDDVFIAITYFRTKLKLASFHHDHTKISHIDGFHADFKTGFEVQDWYDIHKANERHHLAAEDGIRDDVNLIDVLEYIADCVMAGKARAGEVTPLEIDPTVLMRAFSNTWKDLANQVEVVE